MALSDTANAVRTRLRLDSHHAIERFGLFFSVFVLTGLLVAVTSGFSAYHASQASLNDRALYTDSFTTSKTNLTGDVDGVYVNRSGTRAMVMMHFDDPAKMSHAASKYQAYLLGSTTDLDNKPVQTPGVRGSFYVFGSTGYVGVLLDAKKPFDSQVLNLVMRANAELAFSDQRDQGQSPGEIAGDTTYRKYDQWQVYFNPGAHGTHTISALNADRIDPAKVYYQTVAVTQERTDRKALNTDLLKMRADLTQIRSYTRDLVTTSVDGLHLKRPKVPAVIKGDKVIGTSADESKNGKSSLRLVSDTSVPGGFDFDWRSGNVLTGYLNGLVPAGESYVSYLGAKQKQTSTSSDDGISDITWMLSDGTDLAQTAQTNSTLQPLITVMNNLSGAYQQYLQDKTTYQGSDLLKLLVLDANLQDVRTNGSVSHRATFMTVYH